MSLMTQNQIEEVFYDKLVEAVSPVPVRVLPTEKLTAIPTVILQWIARSTPNWGGFGGHVLHDECSYAIIILAKDRNEASSIAQNLKDNLLNLGSLDVDITATPMQNVFIRPGSFSYVYERDDAVQLVWRGILQYVYE